MNGEIVDNDDWKEFVERLNNLPAAATSVYDIDEEGPEKEQDDDIRELIKEFGAEKKSEPESAYPNSFRLIKEKEDQLSILHSRLRELNEQITITQNALEFQNGKENEKEIGEIKETMDSLSNERAKILSEIDDYNAVLMLLREDWDREKEMSSMSFTSISRSPAHHDSSIYKSYQYDLWRKQIQSNDDVSGDKPSPLDLLYAKFNTLDKEMGLCKEKERLEAISKEKIAIFMKIEEMKMSLMLKEGEKSEQINQDNEKEWERIRTIENA